MPSPDFAVRLATADDVDTVLRVLSDGYGRPFTREWFDWKHLECPWGASRCWIADDEGGPLGVVFGMPWPLRDAGAPAGEQEVAAWRLVDGATTVRAQRRGVFKAVVHAELQAAGVGHGTGLVFATATPEAQAAHVKNGAVALEPIRYFYRPVPWVPARLETSMELVDSWLPPSTGLATRWGSAALRWRLDARSGHEYRISRLASATAPHGVVHRTVGGRLRTLVVVGVWGDADAVARTVRAVAWQAKAPLVLAPAGPGTSTPQPRVARARGSSLLCVWDDRAGHAQRAHRLSAWSLDALDLEGLI